MQNEETISKKHVVVTWLPADDYRKLLYSSITNPEFECTINDKEWDDDNAIVKVEIHIRNCSKPIFHQRLIHFIIKTFKNP
jgi:hypothetical protein